MGLINVERLEEFKTFVREYPGLKNEVRDGKASWQRLYEEWYLYGSDDAQWNRYKPADSSAKESIQKSDALTGVEVMTQAFDYFQKMDIDKVQKTMGTVQQFIQIFQTMQGGKGSAAIGAASGLAASTPRRNYSGFFSQFDD